ncbi:universal stress protein [Allosalinactinospora lopnorensis]|uniref:universal stress protein n=1 Tax=Allosalinactinospora lopnorensis TaxID=1352348 RepID=UPI000623CBC0|nr:universal stress protein [Allosalinactinospora lopnorensis]
MKQTSPAKPIVVGYDGSAPSAAALSWAVQEARLRDCDLWVVRVIEGASGAPRTGAAPSTTRHALAARELRHAVEDSERVWSRVLRILVCGDFAAHALARAAEDADLLVLGAPEHSSPMASSVGRTIPACVETLSCPVVIVTSAPRKASAAPVGEHGRGGHIAMR